VDGISSEIEAVGKGLTVKITVFVVIGGQELLVISQ
jgi:hypothetical protein